MRAKHQISPSQITETISVISCTMSRLPFEPCESMNQTQTFEKNSSTGAQFGKIDANCITGFGRCERISSSCRHVSRIQSIQCVCIMRENTLVVVELQSQLNGGKKFAHRIKWANKTTSSDNGVSIDPTYAPDNEMFLMLFRGQWMTGKCVRLTRCVSAFLGR